MKKLVIMAGGECSRIGDFLKKNFKKIPKHILPLPGKHRTLIEAIIYNSIDEFDEIIIEANYQNAIFFKSIFNGNKKIIVEIDDVHSGPLGPIARKINEQERIYACAGDMFCEFSWKFFEDFHNSHEKPISLLIARSAPAPKGARFFKDNNNNLCWERVQNTTNNDFINIGAYIIDSHPKILEIFNEMNKKRSIIKHKEDNFFDLGIKNNLVCAYNPKIIGFNVNVPDVYLKLYNYLKK